MQNGAGLETKWGNVYAGAAFADRFGPVGASAALSFLRADPWEDGRYLRIDTPFRALQPLTGNVSLSFRPWPKGLLTLRANGAMAEGDFFYVAFRGPVSYSFLSAELVYEHRDLLLAADELLVKAHYRRHQIDFSVGIERALPPVDVDADEGSTVASLLYRFPLARRFTTSVGLEDQLQQNSLSYMSRDGRRVNNFAVFLQEKVKALPSLTVDAGVRYEHQAPLRDPKSIVVGQASLVYAPVDRHIFRLGVGQGFKNISLQGRFGNITVADGLIQVTQATDLDPTRLTSLEGGYQLRLGRGLNISLSVYHSWLDNEIENTPKPTLDPAYLTHSRDGTVRLYGGELSTSFALRNRLLVRLAYSLNLTNRPFYRDVPSNSVHSLNLICWLKLLERLDVHLSLYAASFFQQENYLPLSLAHNIVNPIDSLNLRVSYRLGYGLRAVLTGSNLLDLRWGDEFRAGAIDTEYGVESAERIGRRVWLGLEYTL